MILLSELKMFFYSAILLLCLNTYCDIYQQRDNEAENCIEDTSLQQLKLTAAFGKDT